MNINLPTDDEFIRDRNFSYSLAIYLYINSNYSNGEDHRYLNKNKLSVRKISQDMGKNRQTIRKKLKYLLDIKYLKKFINPNGEIVYLIKNNFDKYILIDESISDNLKFLNDFEIRVFVLYKRISLMSHARCCYLDRASILEKLGYCSKSGSNLSKITQANIRLSNLGLIRVEKFLRESTYGFKKLNRIRVIK